MKSIFVFTNARSKGNDQQETWNNSSSRSVSAMLFEYYLANLEFSLVFQIRLVVFGLIFNFSDDFVFVCRSMCVDPTTHHHTYHLRVGMLWLATDWHHILFSHRLISIILIYHDISTVFHNNSTAYTIHTSFVRKLLSSLQLQKFRACLPLPTSGGGGRRTPVFDVVAVGELPSPWNQRHQ